jgi:hypothetical protein
LGAGGKEFHAARQKAAFGPAEMEFAIAKGETQIEHTATAGNSHAATARHQTGRYLIPIAISRVPPPAIGPDFKTGC